MRTLCLMMVLLTLSGCTNWMVRKEIVTVDKPIPYCPAPPVVPVYPFLVDTLTDADLSDPGKVGQYYKHDMDMLRKTDELHRLILQQYTTTSGSFDAIQPEIDKIFKEINEANNGKVESLITK